MRKQRFLEAIGKIDDRLVCRAVNDRIKKKATWLKWGAFAACICLIATAFFLLKPDNIVPPGHTLIEKPPIVEKPPVVDDPSVVTPESDMPSPFGDGGIGGGDGNAPYYEPFRGVFSNISMPEEYWHLIDGEKQNEWLSEHSFRNGATPELSKGFNIYAFMLDFKLPPEAVRQALTPYIGFDDPYFAITEEEIELIVSGDEAGMVEAFKTDYSIGIGNRIYSPQWIYENSIEAYTEAGITPDMILEKVPYYNEIYFTAEAARALRDKLSEFTGEDIELLRAVGVEVDGALYTPSWILERSKDEEYMLYGVTSEMIEVLLSELEGFVEDSKEAAGQHQALYNVYTRAKSIEESTEAPFDDKEYFGIMMTFCYKGRAYDLRELAPSANQITSIIPVENKIVVTCNTPSKHSKYYFVFDIEKEDFDICIGGNNLIWHSDDVTTGIYSYWHGVYRYDGSEIKSFELADEKGEYIKELSFSADFSKVIVTLGLRDGDKVYIVDISDGSAEAVNNDTYIMFEKNLTTLGKLLAEGGFNTTKYSVIDLDGDEKSEKVWWLNKGENEFVGFLIIQSEYEANYAHLLYYREFYNLKADGSFDFSSGAANHGVGTLMLSGDTYEIKRTAYCESKDNNDVSYFIEDESVSKDEFDAFLTKQNEKADAEWIDVNK